MFVEYLFFN